MKMFQRFWFVCFLALTLGVGAFVYQKCFSTSGARNETSTQILRAIDLSREKAKPISATILGISEAVASPGKLK